MPSASAADVHRTILAALNALVPNIGPSGGSQPFATVVTITEPLTKELVPEWVGAQWPCAMLYWQQARDEVDAETLGGGEFEMVERNRWIVYVGVADPRDESSTMLGASGVPGALTLFGTVKKALNGLDIAAPPAKLLFQVRGVPGVTDPVDPRARLQFDLNGGTIEFQLEDASITYGPDPGDVSVVGTCVTPGALGNLPVGMQGHWNDFQPDHSFYGNVTVAGIQSLGAFGTLRNRRLMLREAQPNPTMRGGYYVIAMTFECETSAEQWTPIDESRPLGPINGNVNLTDRNGVETPFASFRANTQL